MTSASVDRRPERSPGSIRERNEQRCRQILGAARPLEVDDLPWSEVAKIRLAPELIDCLVYMRDVEGFVDRDLTGLAGHPTTVADPLIHDFLAVWRREEAGHAAALGRFLGCYREGGADIPAPPRVPSADPSALEALLCRLRGPVGRAVCAAHMAWGAANELLTLNGYRLLAARCEHPVLAALLHRVAAQEARHYAFYMLQAEWRLERSAVARTAVSRVMGTSWTPVGVGTDFKTPAEFGRVLAVLGAGARGRAVIDRMDRRFSALPGLGRLRIFEHARQELARVA